jgi:glycosyltransferase involved in cell wall biosynthesis
MKYEAQIQLPVRTASAVGTIVFVSTMEGYPWGGSEELWSRTALDLAAQGINVAASVIEWTSLHPRMIDLTRQDIELHLRPKYYSLRRHPIRRIVFRQSWPTLIEVERLISTKSPALIVFSHGGALPPVELLERCHEMGVPFVSIGHANSDDAWYSDDKARRYRAVLPMARRCYFVSEANRRLAEKQIGDPIPNAQVIRNPVNIKPDASPPWPHLDIGGEVQFASVGRLHPPSKGQDILFEALAAPEWRSRPWRLNLYGEGPMREVLGRLATTLGIADRIAFQGFVPVEEIWARNHALVMPSRYEGLPLAIVEAMLCARPVIATDVAGHAEVIDDGITGFLADSPTTGSLRATLERFWMCREKAEDMGQAGARKMRAFYLSDPIREFSSKIKEIAGL